MAEPNPAVESLGKWVKRQQEDAERQQYINNGRHQAFADMVEHINQSCMECGEYFYSLDRLAEHQADKHPSNTISEIEVTSYGPDSR